MRILILLFSPPTGTWGSLTRVLSIADAAKKRAHEIAFCASGYLAVKLIKNGYKVYPMPPSTMFNLPKPISKIIEDRSQKFNIPVKPGKSIGSIWFVLMLSGLSGFKYLEGLVNAELKAVDAYKPDLLFTEMDPGAFIISRIRGIRLVSTYASVMKVGIGTKPWKKLYKSMNKILKLYNVQEPLPIGLFEDSRITKIIPSIPELEENITSNSEFIFTGNLLKSFKASTDDSFKMDDTKKYVFVYIGTGSISLNKLIKILPKVFTQESNTICLVGAQSIQKEIKVGNVIFRPYFDAESIIAHCEWVICHGGHNTIIQSLLNGIPLILFPGPIFERRFNAQMVHNSGAGVFAELSDFNIGWLKTILSKKQGYAEKAKELGKKIDSYLGPITAIKAMENILNIKKP